MDRPQGPTAPPPSCPSIERGMSFEEVEVLSAKFADFIQRVGKELRHPCWTTATATILFHRYYTVKAFSDTDPFLVAFAACFLAGKVEDTPKKLKDSLLVMDKLRLQATGNQGTSLPAKKTEDDPRYRELKEQVVKAELGLMKTLRFDLNVEHAYKHVLQYAMQAGGERDLAQTAWNFSNDLLRTRLCVQFRAKALAAGAVFLAAKFLKPKYDTLFSTKFPALYEDADTDITEIEDIANQILDLYERGASAPTAPSKAGTDGTASTGGNSAGAHNSPTSQRDTNWREKERDERNKQHRDERRSRPYHRDIL